MGRKRQWQTWFVLLLLVANLPPGISDKSCFCIPQRSLCKKPPSSNLGYYATAAACVAPLGIAAAMGPLLGLAGFTATGIAGGSLGAWMMSFYGGNVAAGSLVAILQAWGAAGIGTGVWATAASSVVTCCAIFFPSLLNKYSSEPECEQSSDFICFFDDHYAGTAGWTYQNRGSTTKFIGSGPKPSEMYPEGKKVTYEEFYDTGLRRECSSTADLLN